MGLHGSPTCVVKFGENDGCIGWPLGGEGQGMPCMFQMMNEARVGVGFGAALIGYRGYMHSLEYAKDRLQGRKPSEKNPEAPQVPIIEHADVRSTIPRIPDHSVVIDD
jgi:butyryl-CoA dehydrogenase